MNKETVYFNWEVSCPICKPPVINRGCGRRKKNGRTQETIKEMEF